MSRRKTAACYGTFARVGGRVVARSVTALVLMASGAVLACGGDVPMPDQAVEGQAVEGQAVEDQAVEDQAVEGIAAEDLADLAAAHEDLLRSYNDGVLSERARVFMELTLAAHEELLRSYNDDVLSEQTRVAPYSPEGVGADLLDAWQKAERADREKGLFFPGDPEAGAFPLWKSEEGAAPPGNLEEDGKSEEGSASPGG